MTGVLDLQVKPLRLEPFATILVRGNVVGRKVRSEWTFRNLPLRIERHWTSLVDAPLDHLFPESGALMLILLNQVRVPTCWITD